MQREADRRLGSRYDLSETSDELLREKMQREADRRLGSRYDLSETRCTETSSSTKKPRISRRELLLVTSKKAKALAAIKRQR
ncbi:hypothetical protein Tcan_14181 [Toxocara canis]|uniref:Uncharacterized protein n=1 Tax=Toxocara canis TaxID=6265 RepID=A0A0B2UVT5_TOXCA|nr:hypothetical protein Tcan_14181 [Toxocara canis]